MIRGGILGKEGMEGTHWRVGDIEKDGRTKIGMLAARNNNNGHAFLGFEGRLEGATNVPRTMIPQPLPHPPPPTLLNINIGVPCTMDFPQPSHTGESPIILVGDYVPAMYRNPNVLVIVGRYPISIPTPSIPFPSLQPSNHHQGITIPFSTSGNPVVMSVSPSDLSIAVKVAPRPPHLFPHPIDVVTAIRTHTPFIWIYSMPSHNTCAGIVYWKSVYIYIYL